MADLTRQPGNDLTADMDDTRRVCPLCKRPLEAAAFAGSDTRLCEHCRSIVGSILPASRPGDAKPSQLRSAAASGRAGESGQNQTHDAGLLRWPEPLDTNPLSPEQPTAAQNDLLGSQPSGSPSITDSLSGIREAAAGHSPGSQAEYYDTEWPIIAGADEPEPSSFPWKLLLLAPLMAALGTGAFFAYRAYVAPKPKQAPAASIKPAPTAAAPQDRPAEKSPPANAEAASSAEKASPQSGDPTSSGQSAEGKGMFSLQAASVPNEAGAKEFSEKLIRAGIPAYVVAADLGPRGRWFRVRAGRFNDRSEASKFAEQARQRARAAGLNLQLIVCDYEKP